MAHVLPDRFDLTGRVALVTGASRGIGRALALGLAELGADVAVHYATRSEQAEDVAAAIRAMGRRAITLRTDLADRTGGQTVVADAIAALGRLDILVANASSEHRHPWNAMPDVDFDAEIDANLHGPLAMIAAAHPVMAQNQWGRILLIGSIQSVKPNPRLVVYAALKAAVANIARNLSRTLGEDGITINVLSPGAIATERNAAVLADPAYRARVEGQIPLQRIGNPDDCVGACQLLCSNAGRYITGVELFVDGGWQAT